MENTADARAKLKAQGIKPTAEEIGQPPAVHGKPELTGDDQKAINWGRGIRAKELDKHAGTPLEQHARDYFEDMKSAHDVIGQRDNHTANIQTRANPPVPDGSPVADAIQAAGGPDELTADSIEEIRRKLYVPGNTKNATAADIRAAADQIKQGTPEPTNELKGFADQVQGIADKLGDEHGSGGDFRFIGRIHEASQADPEFPRMALPEFKAKLIEANKARHLTLSRADLVQAHGAEDVAASETKHPAGSTFHFVKTTSKSGGESATPATDAERASTGRRAAIKGIKPGASAMIDGHSVTANADGTFSVEIGGKTTTDLAHPVANKIEQESKKSPAPAPSANGAREPRGASGRWP